MEFLQNFSAAEKLKTVCALGNFDGVHLGHRKIISVLKDKAKHYGAKSCAVTFNPHPQKFMGNKTVRLLMPFEEKLRLLEKSGLDMCVSLEFCEDLALMSPESFIREIMVEKAGTKAMVVGPRFRFGNKRKGDVDILKNLGDRFGFETTVLEPARVGDTPVSSSGIRDLILEGRIETASALLGYDYYVKGFVDKGKKRGREIGFPTVNLKTDWEILPAPGVYATTTVIEGKSRKSITNIGRRPTFGEDSSTVTESHLLDTDGDFYGKAATLEFTKRIRDEKKFGSARELCAQIEKDIEQVRAILKNKEEKQTK